MSRDSSGGRGDQGEHVPANIVHPGVKMFRDQPVADGPAGPDGRRRPVGTDGRHAVHDVVRPTAGGPVGRFPNPGPLKPSKMSSPDDSYQPLVTGPLGTNGMYAVNDPCRPTAGGPLGQLFSLDPMAPRGMSSLGDGNQPPSVGPVGKPLITERLGDQVSEPDCKRTIQTRSESESYSGVPDTVIQTGSEVQPDRVNISTANGPTESRETPPSSDSGVHSLGEQWENMSTNSRDTVSVQNEEPSYGGNTSQVVSMYSRPQNTVEGVKVGCPETVYVVDKTLVDILPGPKENRTVVFNDWTSCGNERSIVYSGTDSRNSDIAAMSDFSDDEDSSRVESRPRTPTGCARVDSVKEESTLCDQPIADTTTEGVSSDSLDPNDKEYWTKFRLLTRQAFLLDDDKLSESNYPDAVKEVVMRSRLTIMGFNECDDTPLEQGNEVESSDYWDSEDASSQCMSNDDHREEDYYDWHYDTTPVMPGQTADDANKAVRNVNNNGDQCPALRDGDDDKHDLYSEPGGRAKSDLTTTEAVIENDILGVDYAILDTDEQLVTRVSMITSEVSRLDIRSCSNDPAGIQECVCPEQGKRDDLSAHVNLQLWVEHSQRNLTDRCFGLWGISDYLNRPESDWCWDCVDRLVWGYHVSCVVTIVTKTRSLGIDVFLEERCIYASTRGVGDGPITAYDVIPVYGWMKEKFKDGLNKVMLVNKTPVDSCYHQRGGDNGQVRRKRASVDNRPIRVWGRFGCWYSLVHGTDWLDVLPVGGSRVGKDVWIGYIGDGFSQCQSPAAAPLTELQDINTLLHDYSNCATRLYLIWAVSITVRIRLCVEEVTSCCGDLSKCRTMDGAALADDQSGVTFTAELCMPWDAPEAVIDLNSPDLVSLGSFPDKVGLFGRRKDAAVSRIMAGRDSRSVRFVVPDGRVVDRGYHDVTVVDMEEEREPMVVLNDMTRLRELWPVEVFDHMKWYQQLRRNIRRHVRCRVNSAERSSGLTCTVMWPDFTWIWCNCGGAP